jgi:hypothetical protein
MKSEFTSLSVSVNPILAFRILSPCDTYAIRHGLAALAVKVWKHLCGDRDMAALTSIYASQRQKRRAGLPDSLA